MRTGPLLAALAFLAAAWMHAAPAAAAVAVVENRTAGKIDFTTVPAGGKESRHTLAPGDVLPIPAPGAVTIAFSDGPPRRLLLQPNTICYFTRRDKRIDLVEVALPAAEAAVSPPAPPASPDSVYTIPVKILADDQEPRVQEVWEKRIRSRLAAASDIFQHACRVRFQVAAVGSWVSDEKNFLFDKALADFERKVRPGPARLAIGFTGQVQWVPGERHGGGTRSPLHSYILIREAYPQMSEAERLEILVHELGHFLGAVHTADGNSVMRPALGDRRARARSFRIGFDAPNTLAMNLVADELRSRAVSNLAQLLPATKAPLTTVYALLAKSLPGDPTPARNLALLRVNGLAPAPLSPLAAPAETRRDIEKKKAIALAAAQSWLALVDQRQYDECWDVAADYLKKAVGKDDFVRSLHDVRRPLGRMEAREVESKEYRTRLPGAPDGQYVLIRFKTSFKNQESAVETIAPMLGRDGEWRVSGYSIK